MGKQPKENGKETCWDLGNIQHDTHADWLVRCVNGCTVRRWLIKQHPQDIMGPQYRTKKQTLIGYATKMINGYTSAFHSPQAGFVNC
mmetsp:Transcript_74756/g.132049  ORF Transcript_74756/g.132049 Transcript_74756/m.132049 type:complete len:87 (-) Transcript_74756:903-1163(-)